MFENLILLAYRCRLISSLLLEYLIINMFKTELENNGVKLGKIKREYVIDDIGVLRIGYILPIMYYEEGEKIYLFLSKNYADYSSIEQILIREKILREKMEKGCIYVSSCIYYSKKIL
ncbi:MAG: hypothetical protein QXN74_07220 [Saccharolobus sp.]